MSVNFKKVKILEKSYKVIDLLTKSSHAIGITEICKSLGYNKSTVYNIAYTLCEVGVLEKTPDNKFSLGIQFYVMGRAAGSNSELLHIVHPYLERIQREMNLSAFVGMLVDDHRVVTFDKVDSPVHLRVSVDVGGSTPVLAGVLGKVFLSRMPDDKVEDILSRNELKRYTKYSCVDKKKFRKILEKVRTDGYALSDQEYIEGIRSLAVPLNGYKNRFMLAIYVVGLPSQLKMDDISSCAAFLKEVACEINTRLSFT